MSTAIFTFVALFALMTLAGLLMVYRQAGLRRLAKVMVAPADSTLLLKTPAAGARARVVRLIEPFQRMLPRSSDEVSVMRKRLIRAGYREKSCLNVFYGAKVLVPILLCMLLTLIGVYAIAGPFAYVMALGLGFILPDFWLGHKIKARQTNLRLGLPDALDLIIICVEAGLGVDRAVLRAGEEMRISQPEIAQEFAVVGLEQRAGHSRVDAWRSFGERTGVDSIRALASILIQADKFGTSVGKALRSHADTLRTRRRQDAEEQAAKTTVKLIFPLVLFIFPALFVVTLGPSMIVIMEEMLNFLK
jgi:tight adherence protein C